MRIKELTDRIINETKKIIVGKDEEIRLVVMAVIADGHVLLEDLPGSGKTTLVKTLSKVLGLEAGRIQFVPDLLPSDVTGMMVYNQKKGEFELRKGPVMTNILLADEINRAIPRTQSALLEAMEERQVTIDNEIIRLPSPFLVLATQNPVEMESTFRLPVAQMDRFLLRISLGYLDHDGEVEMLQRLGDRIPFDAVEPVTDRDALIMAQQEARSVVISDSVTSYIVRLVQKTRDHSDIVLGVSPRGSRALYKSSKVWAAMEGRDFVTPDDVKKIAPYVLGHRITLTAEAIYSGMNQEQVIGELLDSVKVGADTDEIVRTI